MQHHGKRFVPTGVDFINVFLKMIDNWELHYHILLERVGLPTPIFHLIHKRLIMCLCAHYILGATIE